MDRSLVACSEVRVLVLARIPSSPVVQPADRPAVDAAGRLASPMVIPIGLHLPEKQCAPPNDSKHSRAGIFAQRIEKVKREISGVGECRRSTFCTREPSVPMDRSEERRV